MKIQGLQALHGATLTVTSPSLVTLTTTFSLGSDLVNAGGVVEDLKHLVPVVMVFVN